MVIAPNATLALHSAQSPLSVFLALFGLVVVGQSLIASRLPSSGGVKYINVTCAFGGLFTIAIGLLGGSVILPESENWISPQLISVGIAVFFLILSVFGLRVGQGLLRRRVGLDPRAERSEGEGKDISAPLPDNRNSEKEVDEEAYRFEALVRGSKDAVIGVDEDGRVWHWNPAAQDLFRVTSQSIIGQPLSELQVVPGSDLWRELVTLRSFPYESSQRELEVLRGDGSILPVWVSISALPCRDGGTSGFGLIARDMSEKRRIEERVSEALIQKNLVLKELHHRVKNNLQLICSLLRLQSKETTDEQALGLFRSSEERIRTLALVHDRLYRSPSFSSISFAECLRDLVDQLVRGIKGLPLGFEVAFDLDEVELPIDSAITCALIANELVAERLKPGIRENVGEFTLRVFLKRHGQSLQLGLWDNGREVCEPTASPGGYSLGLNLVRALLKQVGGELEVVQSDGVLFTTKIPSSVFVDKCLAVHNGSSR